VNRTKLLLLEGWTKALDQLLTKQNIKAWFKLAKMQLLNLKAFTPQQLQRVKVKVKMITHQMTKLV
jgi:hypothetical protein